MGLLEPITHKEEIDQLISDAKSKYDTALRKFESQKKNTTNKLEELAKIKINSWTNGMESFVIAFDSFANVTMDKRLDTNMSFIGSDVEPSTMLVNIQNASITAGEVAKVGFAAIGTGALVGIASYGGAMMFGSASTGTAIAALSGVAKTNATLAWFGGGAKATGGLGMACGKLVLAGIVALPILAVGGIIAAAKGKERLAEAKKINAEARDASEKLDIMTTGMSGIANMSSNYSKFIKKFDNKFKPFIDELNRIKKKYSSISSGKIDFNFLTMAEQKSVHLSWLMAQVYYQVLSTTILTDEGTVANEAGTVLNAAKRDFSSIKKDTYKMSGEYTQTANILWKTSANRIMAINFIVMVLLIFAGLMLFKSSAFGGILLFLDSFVAFPIFIKFKDLSESKKYTWRIVRLAASLLIAIILIVLFGGAI